MRTHVRPTFDENGNWTGQEIVPYTAEEEAARDAEEAAELAAKPMADWLLEINRTDQQMTRIEEDIIEALDAATQQRLNQEVMDKYNNKKAVRARKP